MNARINHRLARLEQQAAPDEQDNGKTIDVVLIATALAAWVRGAPLPPVPPVPAHDTVQTRSERLWRVLLHMNAGHTTHGTTCDTCTPDHPGTDEENR